MDYTSGLLMCVRVVYQLKQETIVSKLNCIFRVVCKAAGLMGLALAWYAAELLCCAPCTYTHLHGAAQWGSLGAT